MSCPLCHNLEEPTSSIPEPGAPVWKQSKHIFHFHSSAAAGCQGCALLYNGLRLFKEDWSHEDESDAIEFLFKPGEPFRITCRREWTVLFDLDFLHDASLPRSWQLPSAIGSAPLVSKDPSSVQCADLLAKWLKDCSENHGACQGLDESKPLPTRTLRLSDDGTQVNLEDTSGRTGQYIALSYCWGRPEVHKPRTTTTSTVSAPRAGMLVKDLPRTIQDAINITRSQSFAYLWVDALCIIQDDAADWAREAATMCDVYSNAVLTIVASRSSGCSEGIFGPQNFSRSFNIPYKDTVVTVRKVPQHRGDKLTQLQPTEEIDRRAWVLQENVLSNRVVVYGSDEMRWRCNTRGNCECGTPNPYNSEQLNDCGMFRVEALFKDRTESGIYGAWNEVVMAYSNRSLSHAKDRLPALDGLAQRFQQMMKASFGVVERYRYGIWDQWPVSLLWQIRRNKHQSQEVFGRKSAHWRAPTWSWASVEAPVTFEESDALLETLLTKSNLPAVTQLDNPGIWTIRAPVVESLQARRTSDTAAKPFQITQNGTKICNFRPDSEDLDGQEMIDSYSCAILLVAGNKASGVYAALVLRKAGLPDEPAYVRAGVARFRIRQEDEVAKTISAAPVKEVALI